MDELQQDFLWVFGFYAALLFYAVGGTALLLKIEKHFDPTLSRAQIHLMGLCMAFAWPVWPVLAFQAWKNGAALRAAQSNTKEG